MIPTDPLHHIQRRNAPNCFMQPQYSIKCGVESEKEEEEEEQEQEQEEEETKSRR